MRAVLSHHRILPRRPIRNEIGPAATKMPTRLHQNRILTQNPIRDGKNSVSNDDLLSKCRDFTVVINRLTHEQIKMAIDQNGPAAPKTKAKKSTTVKHRYGLRSRK